MQPQATVYRHLDRRYAVAQGMMVLLVAGQLARHGPAGAQEKGAGMNWACVSVIGLCMKMGCKNRTFLFAQLQSLALAAHNARKCTGPHV